MSIDCKLRIIIVLLCFIIFYLFFITIVGLSLIFGMLVNWLYVFDLYNSNIDYLKDVFLEKPFDVIHSWICNYCFTNVTSKAKVIDKMEKEEQEQEK
jgi:Na+/H+ antiporter NhaD/arsenite permease-like protein